MTTDKLANARQVGGTHYAAPLQHWDLAALLRWDPLQYFITKYVMRWRGKAGLQDLEKAAHGIQKYIELVRTGIFSRDDGYNQPAPHEDWLRLLGVEPDVPVPTHDAPGIPCGMMLVPIGSVSQWKDHTFEGSKDGHDAYRCKTCKVHFKIPHDHPPTVHMCAVAKPVPDDPPRVDYTSQPTTGMMDTPLVSPQVNDL
jgi:hypothetical protein